MPLRKWLLPTFQNVPAGGSVLAQTSTAICELPLGIAYHAITIKIGDNGTASAGANLATGKIDVSGTNVAPQLTDGAPAPYTGTAGAPKNPANNTVTCSVAEFILNNLVGQIRLMLNNTAQWTLTAFELNRLNSNNNALGLTNYSIKTTGTGGVSGAGEGTNTFAVYLTLYFAEPWRDDPEIGLTALNAVGIDGLRLEVDFQPGINTPVIKGTYEWDLPTKTAQQGPGFIKKVRRQSIGATGSTQDFVNLSNFTNKAKQEQVSQIDLFPTLETTPKFVNNLRFTLDGVKYHDLLNTVDNQVILLQRGMSPDVSAVPRYTLAFDYDNPINQALALANAGQIELHCEYNAAAGGTMIATIQVVGQPE